MIHPSPPLLFDLLPALPDGMRYAPAILSADEEGALLAAMAPLAFRAFEFRGYEGRRRVVSFGWRYDFRNRGIEAAEPLPPFLERLRERAAAFAGLDPMAMPHALVTEYSPGSAIGWHRDRPEFGDVVGVSLGAPCRFRLRRRESRGWKRTSIDLPPRSAYLLRGPARSEWEHSIPPVDALRYSVTFRSLNVADPAKP